jgi:hypothetical protein
MARIRIFGGCTFASELTTKQKSKKMKKEFMLLFRYEPNTEYQPTEAELQQMHQEWGGFFGGLAMQEKLVSTHQLGFEGVQIQADKSIVDGMNVHNKMTVGGNVVLLAYSMDEAVEMAKACPIFEMGGTVEVRSIQAM